MEYIICYDLIYVARFDIVIKLICAKEFVLFIDINIDYIYRHLYKEIFANLYGPDENMCFDVFMHVRRAGSTTVQSLKPYCYRVHYLSFSFNRYLSVFDNVKIALVSLKVKFVY